MKNTSKLKKPALFKTIGIIFITMWALLSMAGIVMGAVAPAGTPISDGFDYPVGIPDGTSGENGLGYYVIAGFKDTSYKGIPHLGEDWNSRECATCDLGDPVYAISNGFVRYARDTNIDSWTGVIIIDHTSLSGFKFKIPNEDDATKISSMYAHLNVTRINEWVYEGEYVRRGQLIGVIGPTPAGSTGPHLHFEIRNDTSIGLGPGYSLDTTGWIDPRNFINANRPQITPLIGDWNGDNIDTTGTFDPRTLRFSLDNGATALMGEPGDLPLVGDWDGSDGKDTIGVYRPKTAHFFLDDNNDGIRDYEPINFGDIGDFPIVGDWDGDGDDDIGVFRSLDFATWKTTFFLNKSDGSVERIEFGQETDIPIVGDWDNDGKDDTGVFRRNDPDHENNAVFYLKIGTETIDIVYGNNDDIPIVGKWDSDGLTKIGVYRPTTQQFIFNHTPLVDSGDHPIWYVDDDLQDYPNADFTRIQDAVDAASDGDTIIAYPGTYTENVDVNKDYITIKSENGAESTFIQAADPDDHVFEIIGDYVNISGFTATGATQGVGFHLHGDYCNISYNNALNNYHGISLYRSNNNQIKENAVVSNGFYGIFLMESSYNGVLNNIAEDNARAGILINPESNYNNIKGNTASNNNCGIALTSDNNNIIRLNIISLNNFISNTYHNAYSYDSTNIWNSQEQITYTYQGSTYTNYLGNHWGDYTGSDTDGDGIGDEPYSFPPQGRIDNYPLIEPFENYLPTPPPENQPPTCAIKLQKTGVPIANINVGEFFDIYVGGSTDDQGITKVRFSSDDSQDGNPTGEWTDWYDWDTSSGDWNAANKMKRWSFATSGDKEVWAEVKDGDGEVDQCRTNIFAHPGYAIIVAGQDRGSLLPPKPRQKFAIDHSANNAYRVLHNLGFDDDHIFYLNDESQQIDGQNVVDNYATYSYFNKAVNDVKDKIGDNPTPFILYLVGHGIREGDHDYFVFDEDNTDDGYLKVSTLQEMLDKFSLETPMLIVIGSCYSGCFITFDRGSISAQNRIIITACHDDEERISALGLGGWYHSSDRFWGNLNKGLNVKDAFIPNAWWPGEWKHLWLDDNGDNIGHPPDNLGNDGALASATIIGVPGTDDLELTSWYSVWIHSAGELRVYDSQNRVTGLVNAEIKGEIPDSIYDEQDEIVAIFSPSDSYRHEVVGTDGGTYGLDIASFEAGEATIFTATDIPTTIGATHEYTIEWAALSQGEAGVTVQVDSDGDGTFEYTFSADNELTQEEFLSGTDGEPIPEFTTIAIPVAIVLGLVFLISRRKRKEE